MEKIKKLSIIGLFIILVALAACSENKSTSDNNNSNENNNASGEKQVEGGDMHYALGTQPPSIDPVVTTATATSDIARHIYETLVTVDSSFEPQPMLAESWDESEDGLTYTFHLREGVKFHNGDEMKAEDVVASMNRWLEKSATAQALIADGKFEEVDEYTVDLTLKDPSIFTLSTLAGTLQFPAIMPKDIVEGATESGVEEHIGTAPFKFSEWKQDQYIMLEKFDDYQPREEDADGLAGERIAYFDKVYFDIVTDANTLLNGLTTEEYDIGSVDYDMFEQVESAPNMEVIAPMYGQYGLVFNKFEGLFADVKMRQAVNAALNLEDIASVALGGKHRMSSSYMQVEQEAWASDAGAEHYNNKPDQEKVEALLDEAGYDGEPIKFITTREYSYMYDSAVIIKEQLENMGINVDLEVFDWATVVNMRADPSKWNALITGFPITMTPIEQLFYNDTWIDGPTDDKTDELLKEIAKADTIEEAKEIWDELQGHSWEVLPILKISDYPDIVGVNEKVDGFYYLNGPVFWNASFKQ